MQDIERQWKAILHAGNDAFAKSRHELADEAYLRAISLIRRHFCSWAACNADDAVAALVVSHLNRVDTQIRLQAPDAAAEILRDIHTCLMSFAESVKTAKDLRIAALRHANQTYAVIKRFQADHGAPEND